jgi:hypothetical protein
MAAVPDAFFFTFIPFRDKIEMMRYSYSGAANMPKKALMGWFRSIATMVFYIGLFSGIGYLIQVSLF